MGKQLRTARHTAMIAAMVAARQKLGLTQREAADKIKRSHSFFGKIESGERQLNVLEFWEIAELLGIDPVKMFADMVSRIGKGKR